MFKFIITLSLIVFSSQLAFSQSSWLRGSWEGIGYQTDSDETYTIKFRAQKRKFIIEYPSLECSGVWRLIGLNQSRARFREEIKINREKCEPVGNVIIQRLNRSQLLFLYSYLGQSKITTSAVLNRAKATVRNPPIENQR